MNLSDEVKARVLGIVSSNKDPIGIAGGKVVVKFDSISFVKMRDGYKIEFIYAGKVVGDFDVPTLCRGDFFTVTGLSGSSEISLSQ